MIRGSTPLQVFNVNADLSDFNIYLTYSQNDKPVVELTHKAGLELVPGFIIARLTQEQTLAFEPGIAKVQLRAIDKTGIVPMSDSVTIAIEDALKDGVIEYVD